VEEIALLIEITILQHLIPQGFNNYNKVNKKCNNKNKIVFLIFFNLSVFCYTYRMLKINFYIIFSEGDKI
jgi:hypothetical protein